jgi:hypothetical protein
LCSRKKDPKTGKRRNLGTFKTALGTELRDASLQAEGDLTCL